MQRTVIVHNPFGGHGSFIILRLIYHQDISSKIIPTNIAIKGLEEDLKFDPPCHPRACAIQGGNHQQYHLSELV